MVNYTSGPRHKNEGVVAPVKQTKVRFKTYMKLIGSLQENPTKTVNPP